MLDLKTNTNIEGIVMAYQNSEIAQNVTAQMLFGAIDAKGKLPVSVGLDFPVGTSYETKSLKRLSYGLPESVGMNSYKLKKMDSLINITLEKEMTPGFQMLIAKDGKVVYNKNFGYHTYEKTQKVTDSSLYDVASLTKILATLPLVMELEENNTINLNTKLKDILPQLSKSNKKNITIKQMLSHYAKLPAWIPFYLHTMDTVTKRASVKYYRDKSDSNFNIQVAENFYIRNDYNDSIYKEIADSELRSRLAYKYSDIPYYILKQYLEDYYGNSLHTITQDHFYEPLGANFTTYIPLNSFSKEQIVPTENDTLWRRQVVQGYVHDQGAAMLGGIGGHAGLFSNANDIAKIMQMYLNGGYYGGQRFLKEETIEKFNKTYYKDKEVRRGVGFDKPQLDEVGPTCGCVPMSSFGHSGFTGTYTWADPDNNLIYIFLSNRTYPFASNRKLISEDIRTKLQRLIYEAIDY
jgi:CubicO group peptidase (beta-lactamase class C family)